MSEGDGTDPAADGEYDVLLVEDNPGDVRLTTEGFEGSRFDVTVHVVTDGVDALDFLFRRGSYESAPRPDLILLDLNLPKLDGSDVLSEIGERADLARVPVIVLTSSQATDDVVESYERNANAFLTKPVDPSNFFSLVECLGEFWFGHSELPPLE